MAGALAVFLSGGLGTLWEFSDANVIDHVPARVLQIKLDELLLGLLSR